MIEEKNTSKKKIIIIVGVILIAIIIGVVAWLLSSRVEEINYTGTWILNAIKTSGNENFENATTNEKVVIEGKTATVYVDNIETCKMTWGQKMTCNDKTFEINRGTAKELYLEDQNKNLYKYTLEEKPEEKKVISIHMQNWKIEETKGTLEYPSVEELNSMNNDFITKADEEDRIEISLNLKLKESNDYIKYSFEVVNDGKEKVWIENDHYGITSDEDVGSAVNLDTTCCHDIKCNDEIVSSGIIQSNEKAYCYITIQNKSVTKPTDINVSSVWKVY